MSQTASARSNKGNAAHFRLASDEASGAVKVKAHSGASVSARDAEDVEVSLTIDSEKLPSRQLNRSPTATHRAAHRTSRVRA